MNLGSRWHPFPATAATPKPAPRRQERFWIDLMAFTLRQKELRPGVVVASPPELLHQGARMLEVEQLRSALFSWEQWYVQVYIIMMIYCYYYYYVTIITIIITITIITIITIIITIYVCVYVQASPELGKISGLTAQVCFFTYKCCDIILVLFFFFFCITSG